MLPDVLLAIDNLCLGHYFIGSCKVNFFSFLYLLAGILREELSFVIGYLEVQFI